MMTKTEINIEEIDWKCLNLLSKKEKIAIPDLIGRMISVSLEKYEDFQDAIDIKISENESKGKPTYTHEEFWKIVGI